MRNRMIKTSLLIGSIGVCLLFASAATAQYLPPGSYKNKCTQAKVEKTVLKGECYWEASKIQSNLFDFYLCDGDIGVEKGKLVCNKNQNSALMKKAKFAVRSAYSDATGSLLTGSELPWIREFFDMHSYATVDFFIKKDGLRPSDLSGVFKKYLCQPNEGNLRLETINRAFDTTYGKAPTPTDVAHWNPVACTAAPFFNTIVNAETEKMNANKITRRFMITAAYKRSFGRPALSSELDKWTPLKENFASIVSANRGYMYSSQGAKELAATVERALFNKKGEKPTPAEISAAIIQYSGKKAIFSEM